MTYIKESIIAIALYTVVQFIVYTPSTEMPKTLRTPVEICTSKR